MTSKKRNQLTNINRILILSLTITGLAMNGVQVADLFFISASCIWLWMPVCIRMEVSWFEGTAHD